MARSKTKRTKKDHPIDQREHVLAVFADYASEDVDKLFDFLQHCEIDLKPYLDQVVDLPDLIASHFYVRPGVYDIALLGDLLATFPPIAARIRELQNEMAAKGCP